MPSSTLARPSPVTVSIPAVLYLLFMGAECTSAWRSGFAGPRRKCISFLVWVWAMVSCSGILFHNKDGWKHFVDTEVRFWAILVVCKNIADNWGCVFRWCEWGYLRLQQIQLCRSTQLKIFYTGWFLLLQLVSHRKYWRGVCVFIYIYVCVCSNIWSPKSNSSITQQFYQTGYMTEMRNIVMYSECTLCGPASSPPCYLV